ncbi:MAG TPA: biotin/lipoyl-binding protein, partial [Planctomycetaceae bacterium]|nr:biotin/lipoyl-binding protein [Planctomycetaceae bacterium]
MAWRGAIVVVILLATGCGAAAYWWPFWQPSQTLQLPGIVEIQEVRLGSKIGGRVAEVLVREGDVVEPGRMLVRFDVPELEAQLKQQEGRVAAAEASLLKAKNGPRPEEIRQTENDLKSLQADLQWTLNEFSRTETLFKQKTFTQAD